MVNRISRNDSIKIIRNIRKNIFNEGNRNEPRRAFVTLSSHHDNNDESRRGKEGKQSRNSVQ